MKKKLYIIGAGTGTAEFLTEKGLKLIKSCNVVYSNSKRLSQQFFNIRNDIIESSVSEIQQEIMECKSESIGVLVSGDTGFFSITKILSNSLSSYCEVDVICGISSLQYFCSKIRISYENLKTISLHGRDNTILGAVSYNQYVFVLTGGNNKANLICRSLVDNGLGFVKVTAGENLSMSNENIIKGSPEELSKYSFDDLTVLIIENKNFVRHYLPLKDDDFFRGDVPMTKEEVRCVTLSKLAVEPCDVVYDIGAGTGSVAIEMARKAYDGCVYAIEQNEEGISLINKNRERLGGYNVTVIHGKAPEALEMLPKPDKAFIGGSSGKMGDIVDLLIDKNPKIRLVVNAITLETLSDTVSVFEKYRLRTDVVCMNVANSIKVGGYHMMNANNPVYIITGGSV
jgi:precorrin-6Y C5,15-methyltransferase (decarboxylating)